MMKGKKIIGAGIVMVLTLMNGITSFAGLKVTEGGEISTIIADSRQNLIFGEDTHIRFDAYDPQSGLIPVYQDYLFAGGEELANAKLMFIDTAGQQRIAPNANWELICPFRDGKALVREKNTRNYVAIDTTGAELSRFSVDSEEYYTPSSLPEHAEYDYVCKAGHSGGTMSGPQNLKVMYLKDNGENKVIDLQGRYWKVGNLDSDGRMPLFKMIDEGIETLEIGGKRVQTSSYLVRQMDYIDANGEIHSGEMPGYQGDNGDSNFDRNKGLYYDRTTKSYSSNRYELRRIEGIYSMETYEIYDKAGNSSGVRVCEVVGGADNFLIARQYDENYVKEQHLYNDLKPLYYIYYINEE